jgi:hypothetical protein
LKASLFSPSFLIKPITVSNNSKRGDRGSSSNQPSFETKSIVTLFRMDAADSSPEVNRKGILAHVLSHISLSDRSGAPRTLRGKRVTRL